jgi:hypothetical protein
MVRRGCCLVRRGKGGRRVGGMSVGLCVSIEFHLCTLGGWGVVGVECSYRAWALGEQFREPRDAEPNPQRIVSEGERSYLPLQTARVKAHKFPSISIQSITLREYPKRR